MEKNIKLIIFDLDNTLINYGGVTKKAWDLTCTEMVKHFPIKCDALVLSDEIYKVNNSIWEDEAKRPRGNFSFDELRRSIIQEAFHNLKIDNLEAIEFLVTHYAACKHEAVYVFDDVHPTLQTLKERGYTLALLTNGDAPTQREKLARFDLEKPLDYIFIDGEQGVGKPEKKAYDNVLDACNVKASEACMVGDHYLWEVVAPKKYGLKAIWVNRDHTPIPVEETVKPNYRIENIQELLNIFK